MKIIKTKWLSWTIRAVLALLLCCLFALPQINGYFARRSHKQVEQRYQALVAAGKLVQPPEGLSAVTIRSRSSSGLYFVWFWRGDPNRQCLRYLARKRATAEGKVTWQFHDQETKLWIY